ncbi:MAG: DUF1905 domain-containing protein [Pyrinomonadaceae bacterium]
MPTKAEQQESPSVTFRTQLVTTDTKPVYHYLLVEKKWVEPLGFTGNMRRCVCTVNTKLTFHCSLMPSGRKKGAYYISINKVNREKLGLEPGDTVDVELARDDSKYGMPMPAEFREVLRQDAEGKKLFHALTPGKQRTLLWYTVKYKDEDRRIQTALIMIEHLKKNDGKLIYPQLSEELKLRREPEW